MLGGWLLHGLAGAVCGKCEDDGQTTLSNIQAKIQGNSRSKDRYHQNCMIMSPFRRTLLNHLAFSSASFPKPPLSFDPAAILSAGIRKVAYVRHGNTNKAPSGGTDFDRRLTELGRDQAKAAGLSYGIDIQPFYPVALCSPAPRCVETAKIFLDAAGVAERQIEFVCNQDLYDGTIQPQGSRLFQKIGYAPLRDYYEDPDEDDRKVAFDILGSYGTSALSAIEEVAHEDRRTYVSDGSRHCRHTLLIFAHAVYLPAAEARHNDAAGRYTAWAKKSRVRLPP